MKVSYLFSKNKKLGSKLISWAATFENLNMQDTPSHMAVLLNDTWVVESTFSTGIRVVPYFKWKEINEELYNIPCEKHFHSEEVMQKALQVWGKKYDWLGILYFAWAYIRLIVNKEPIPIENKWQKADKYFCTEFAGYLEGENFSMKSPAKICAEWLLEEK